MLLPQGTQGAAQPAQQAPGAAPVRLDVQSAEEVSDSDLGDAIGLLSGSGVLPEQPTPAPETPPSPITPPAPEQVPDPQPPAEPQPPAPETTPVPGETPPTPPAPDTEPPLPPEVQASVDRRIGQVVAQREGFREQLETEQRATQGLRAQVGQLTQQLNQASIAAAQAQGASPLLLVQDETQLMQEEQKMRNFLQWADEYEEEGFPGDENSPAFTPKEIRTRRKEIERELMIVPQARQALQRRRQVTAYAATVYPTLADPQSEDFRMLQNVLQMVPGLRSIPDAHLFVGDMIAGFRIRKARQPQAQQAQAATPPPAPTPPAMPQGGAAPRVAAQPAATPKKETGPTVDGFVKAGADRNALQSVGLALMDDMETIATGREGPR